MFEKDNFVNKITKSIAILLMSAILDNTLNLKAKITTQRDKIAYEKLKEIAKEENYAEKYFKECQKQIEKDLKTSIENDTKIEKIAENLPEVFSQLVVWDKENILKNCDVIYDFFEYIEKDWMMNLICLKDGTSYFISDDKRLKNSMEKVFDKKFDNNIMVLGEVWLRKEIIKKAL